MTARLRARFFSRLDTYALAYILDIYTACDRTQLHFDIVADVFKSRAHDFQVMSSVFGMKFGVHLLEQCRLERHHEDRYTTYWA